MPMNGETGEEMPLTQCLEMDITQPGTSPYAINLPLFGSNQWKIDDMGLIAFW